jgi:predicted small lipoprotein YifL
VTGSGQRRRWPEVVLALALSASLCGCALRGPSYGKASPQRSPSRPTSEYQGSFVYPSVGEYDGERMRNSNPKQILNSAYEDNY